MFVIVPGVFAEPDLTMLTLAYLPTNPVLIYHPDITLTSGVYLVGHSNGTGFLSGIFYVSHCSRLWRERIREGMDLVMVQGR